MKKILLSAVVALLPSIDLAVADQPTVKIEAQESSGQFASELCGRVQGERGRMWVNVQYPGQGNYISTHTTATDSDGRFCLTLSRRVDQKLLLFEVEPVNP